MSSLPDIKKESYSSLALFLSPFTKDSVLKDWLSDQDVTETDWNRLLFLANSHAVSPLWYACLKHHSLLTYLPTGMAEYLSNLYLLNTSRNQKILSVLKDILTLANSVDLVPVLLKGTASLVQDIYLGLGCRMQSDIDILLSREEAVCLQEKLMKKGFSVVPQKGHTIDLSRPIREHHHLEMLEDPKGEVGIEIHYRINHGRVDDVFKNVETEEVMVGDMMARKLTPVWQDLHNLLHAMVVDRGTINSLVPLKAAAESAWLLYRYPEADYQKLAKVVEACGFSRDYHLYRAVAQKIGLWPGNLQNTGKVSSFRVARCLEYCDALTNPSPSLPLSLYIKLYNALHFPRWAWNYICYMDSNSTIWDRLKRMGGFLVRPAAWKKI